MPPANINIDCVPTTVGQPQYTPDPDQLPFAYDEISGILWIHQCPNTWIPFNFALCSLAPAQINGLINPCQVINVPITYDRGAGCEQGTLTLDEFTVQVAACLNLTGTGNIIDLQPASSNVTINQSTVGGVTTFTIAVSAQPLSDVTEVQQSGNLIATHDDGSGTVSRIEETITTLVPDGSGGFNFTNEVGAIVNLPAQGVTTLVPDGSGGFNFTNQSGATVNIPGQTVTTLVPDGSGGFNYTNELGAVVNIPSPPTQTPETVTTLTPDGAGGFDYTNELGAVVNIPASTMSAQTVTTLLPNVNGDLEYVNEAGVTTVIPAESITTMVANANGSFTYTNEAGVTTNIPAAVVTTLVPNAVIGGFDYTNEVGAVVNIPAAITSSITNQNSVSISNAVNQIAEHDDGAGNIEPINETITTLLPNATVGGFDYTNEVGDVVNIPVSATMSGAASTTLNALTLTNTITGQNVTAAQLTYTRVDPNKQVLVLIDGSLDMLFDPVAAGVNGQNTDIKTEFSLIASISGNPVTVATNRIDNGQSSIAGGANAILYRGSSGVAQRLVNTNTVTVQLSLSNLTVMAGNTALTNGAGTAWGLAPESATVTFIEV